MRKDSYGTGVLAGLAFVAAGAALWTGYDALSAWLGPAADRLRPPAIQFVLLGVAMILFRFMMVRWDMARTARGLLFVVFLGTLAALLHHRYSMD